MVNERIIEMAKQCGYWSGQTIEMNDVGISKFAELIVRECIEKSLEEQIDPDLIDQEQDIEDRCYLRGSNSGIITAVCAIEQHFRVE